MKWLRSFVAGVLLAGAPALVPCVVAQVDVIPAAVEASLPAGQQGEVALVVTNENAAPADLYAVPLPEEGVPEDVGELLFHTDPGTVHDAWDLTMTPDGRLFAATYGGGGGTREYTSELALVREFDSPHLGFSSYTTGLAWMLPEHAPPGYPEGTLWWMDVEVDPDGPVIHVDTIFLIEGGLDGNETGRMVELIVGPGHPPHDRGVPLGLAYDAEEELFYYVDIVNEDIYAIDVEGTVAEGYPVPLTDYDDGSQEAFPINSDIDATRGADGGTYLEAGFVQRGEDEYSRVVVVDRWGRNTGVETSLGDLTAPDGEGPLVQVNGALRSRLDPPVMYPPVMYLAVYAEQVEIGYSTPWIYAIRAHPLPPRWLRTSAAAPASLALAPGETDTLTVRLNTEGMEPGEYRGQVALRAGGPNGEEAVTVPVTLTVTQGTDTEDEAEVAEGPSLAVYPNPSAGAAVVALTLDAPSDVRVAVFDLLGREVAVLHDGSLAGGEHELRFNGAGLPAGVYLVRVEGSTPGLSRLVTLMR